MAAHVLRLRLALLLGALRGDRDRATRTVIALVVTLVVAVASILGILSLRDASIDAATTVLVLAGSAVLLGFLLAPVMAGSADPLDPRGFAVFGVDERRMPWLLALASIISVPTWALMAVSIAFVITAVSHGANGVLAVLSALLTVFTAALAARVSMALGALLLPARRSRELSALFALAVIVVAVPVAVFVASMSWDDEVPVLLGSTAAVLGMTPLGASTAFPLLFAAGQAGAAWGSLLIALGSFGGILALWHLLVRWLLTGRGRVQVVRDRPGLGWFALLPSSAFGAIAARSLVYWLRDRRYLVNLVIVPIAAVLTVVPLLVAGVPLSRAAALPVIVIALFLGWMPHNDVAYDSTAFWVHVSSGVRGLPDRLGRLVPILLIGIPSLAVAIAVTLAVLARWTLLPTFIGVTVCLLLSGLGLSSISSVLTPYAVSRPGDSPFQQPQRVASRGTFGQAFVFLTTMIVSAPVLWLGWQALTVYGASVFAPLWAGLVIGFGLLALGLFVGARLFERRSTQIMEFVETV